MHCIGLFLLLSTLWFCMCLFGIESAVGAAEV